MTRICSWCKAVLGEKCSACDGRAVVIGGGTVATELLYKCLPCGKIFEAGEGGKTDTICDACRESQVAGKF